MTFSKLKVKLDGTENKKLMLYKVLSEATETEPATIQPLGWRSPEETGEFYCEINEVSSVYVINSHPENKNSLETKDLYIRYKGLIKKPLPNGSEFSF